MAQSAQYPDLRMVQPRGWGRGRDGKAPRYIVIHYTAGSERSTSAEDGAAYDQRRTDGTSTHYFVDRDSVVQCVSTEDRANAALYKGNRLGIQYELCGTVQSRAEWLDEASLATLKNAAKQIARDCLRYSIPVRRLTPLETRRAWTEYPDGPRGIVGHVDCTQAYPEDGGDHTDPGPQFPWDVLLGLIQTELDSLKEPPVSLTADDIVQAQIKLTDPCAERLGKPTGSTYRSDLLLQRAVIDAIDANVAAEEILARVTVTSETVERRLASIEAKIDEVLTALRAAGH
ncbi:MAG TPA: N-acetylmuramoyl-L-alanine amidase [Micromonospora sp.]|nr:N-acetylmuramoyl-L-alanine amidase [Micromonospora sp.]